MPTRKQAQTLPSSITPPQQYANGRKRSKKQTACASGRFSQMYDRGAGLLRRCGRLPSILDRDGSMSLWRTLAYAQMSRVLIAQSSNGNRTAVSTTMALCGPLRRLGAYSEIRVLVI